MGIAATTSVLERRSWRGSIRERRGKRERGAERRKRWTKLLLCYWIIVLYSWACNICKQQPSISAVLAQWERGRGKERETHSNIEYKWEVHDALTTVVIVSTYFISQRIVCICCMLGVGALAKAETPSDTTTSSLKLSHTHNTHIHKWAIPGHCRSVHVSVVPSTHRQLRPPRTCNCAAAMSCPPRSMLEQEILAAECCPICEERLSHGVALGSGAREAGAEASRSVDRRPRLLPCGHTCCNECVRQIIMTKHANDRFVHTRRQLVCRVILCCHLHCCCLLVSGPIFALRHEIQCPICRTSFCCTSADTLAINYHLMQLLMAREHSSISLQQSLLPQHKAVSPSVALQADALAVAGAPGRGIALSPASSSNSVADTGTRMCASCNLRKSRALEFTSAQLKKQDNARCKTCVGRADMDGKAAAAVIAPQPAAVSASSSAPASAPAAGSVAGVRAAAMPTTLRHLPLQRMPRPRDRTMERQAQELIWDSWDLPCYSTEREQLVARALQLCPDLPDALVTKCDRWIHKSGERDPVRALPFLEHALVAAADRLGSDYIRQHAGALWGNMTIDSDTSDWCKPYMRALYAYANTLWDVGRQEEAIAYAGSVTADCTTGLPCVKVAGSHLIVCAMWWCVSECLRLNNDDNQGVRYLLSSWLLQRDELDNVQAILDQFPSDCSTMLAWNRALHLFKRGDRDLAAAAAHNGKSCNRMVPGYLLGVVAYPEESPASITVSGDSEAAEYARLARHVWQQTPGALEWLAAL